MKNIGIFGLLVIGVSLLFEKEESKYNRHKKENDLKNNNSKYYLLMKYINDILDLIQNKIRSDPSLNSYIKEPITDILILSPGDHIGVDRTFPFPYTHHGICVGEDKIIHYTDEGVIKLTDMNTFKSNSKYIYKINSYCPISKEEVVKRAYSKLGETKYNLITNNCESFALWCRYGI